MPFYLTLLMADVGGSLLGDASYVWVIIFLVLTGCGLPIPEEVGIIAAGVWAADGAMDFWLGLAACLFGCLVGDSIMYSIGYRFGKSVLREHPLFAGFLTPEREKQIEQMIRRRGAIVLFTARFLIGVRGPVYLTAGILHFPYRRFLITDLVCATIVVSLFYSLAWYYGKDIIHFIRTAEEGITVVIAIVVAAAAVFFWIHHRRSKQMLHTLDRATDVLSTHHQSERDSELTAEGGDRSALDSTAASPSGNNGQSDSPGTAKQSERKHAERMGEGE